MGTTGAPWFIPFVEPTDIPRTYPQDSEDLADAIAAGLSAAGAEGIGPAVVQTVLTTPFTTSATSYDPVTGLEVNFTPSSTSSKVLVLAYVNFGTSGIGGAGITLRRGSTDLMLGDTSGSRMRASSGTRESGANGDEPISATIVFLDSPNVDTQVTYSIAIRAGTESVAYVNRTGRNLDDASFPVTASSITVIEVQG